MAMRPTPALRLPAPAKLNGFLHVTGRRPDGYHSIETLFVLVDRGDAVTLTDRGDGNVVRERGAAGVTPEADLAVRAARLMQRDSGSARGVTIAIDKNIPMGAGLGGGSSDAATVLLGLNRLWGLACSRTKLMQLALELGADVPFFIFGEPALGRGVGEELAAVSLPPTWFVLLVPGTPVSTASIFEARELTRNTASAKMPVFPEGFGSNDLQAVAAARFPEIAAGLEALARGAAGQAGAGARMSGSGSCVYAAFAAEDAAAQALSRVQRAGGLTGFVTRALNRHPLWRFAGP
jgi:4-diphosphocytidyl-2-C-methyl-D-erythritol kinase